MKQEYVYRKIIMYGDLNGAGNLFGGRALSWIDEAAGITVADFSKLISNTSFFVTKLMSGIDFKSPGHINDIICITTEIYHVGNTSITLRVNMTNTSTGHDIIIVDKIVFVLVNIDGHPIQHNLKL